MTPAQFSDAQHKLGMSDTELAEALGVNRSTVYRIKHGTDSTTRVMELAIRWLLANNEVK